MKPLLIAIFIFFNFTFSALAAVANEYNFEICTKYNNEIWKIHYKLTESQLLSSSEKGIFLEPVESVFEVAAEDIPTIFDIPVSQVKYAITFTVPATNAYDKSIMGFIKLRNGDLIAMIDAIFIGSSRECTAY